MFCIFCPALRMRRHALTAMALLLACLLPLSPAFGLQVVSLDFDTLFDPIDDPDDYDYAPDERMAIKSILEDMFRSDPGDPEGGIFGVKFEIFDPLDPPLPFTTTLAKFNSASFGVAEKIDFRNLDDADDVELNAVKTLKLFDGTERSDELGGGFWTVPELTDPFNVVLASAQIAAHELAHVIGGLRHHDGFGPIGAGIAVSPASYTPAYPGPSGMTLTSQHIMGLNSSVALNANTLLTPNHFAERSALKLMLANIEDDIGPNPYVIFETEYPEGDAQDETALADETPIPLVPLGVPNTLESPHPWAPIHGGPDFLPAEAAVLVGSSETRPPGSSDGDNFGLTLSEPTRLTVEVLSHSLRAEEGGRIVDWVDLNMVILDGITTLPVPYETGEAFSEDQFESLDPIVFDVDLPAGEYIIEIFPESTGATGDYEILVYTFPDVDFPLIGDYNDDGRVDAADYTVWRDNEGTAFPLPNRDPANAGLIGPDDYVSWVENFGEFDVELLDGPPSNSTPEPGTLAILLIGLTGFASGYRHR